MILVTGLGNPGAGYAKNRHNIGFMAVDLLAHRHTFSPWRSKFQSELCEGQIAGERVMLLKPQTYMNLSGQAVAAAMRFLKLPLESLVVIHDDLDLAPGKVRVKCDGGAGGHNGLKSIDSHIGQGYRRIRIGIGHPGDRNLVSPYVLQDFSKAEVAALVPVLSAIVEASPLMVAGDDNAFASKVGTLSAPPRPPKPPRPPGVEKVNDTPSIPSSSDQTS